MRSAVDTALEIYRSLRSDNWQSNAVPRVSCRLILAGLASKKSTCVTKGCRQDPFLEGNRQPKRPSIERAFREF